MRKFKHQISSHIIPYVYEKLQGLTESKAHLIYIKGGKAWESIYNKTSKNKSDVKYAFTSSNLDLECIVYGKNEVKNVTNITKILYTHIKAIVSYLNNTIPVVTVNGEDYLISYELDKSSNIYKTGTPKQKNDMVDYNLEVLRDGLSVSIKYQVRGRKRKHNSLNFEDILLYVPIYFYGDRFDIESFKSAYLEPDSHFLNHQGLLIHDMFLEMDRKEKGVNIDLTRRNWLLNTWYADEKYMLKQIHIFKQIYKTSTKNIFKPYHVSNLYKMLFDFKYPKLIKKSESDIIEKYRGILNFIVCEINRTLHTDQIQAACFVVGGDAMRRYVSNINISSDIDLKLYYNKAHDRHAVLRIVALICCKYITLFNSNYFKIEPCASRLRYIQLHDGWPLDLFTIDYEYKLPFDDRFIRNNTTVNTAMYVNMVLPMLDIGIQHNKTNLSTLFNNNGFFAVAKKSFLIKDIENTHTDELLYKQRVWVNKVSKNLNRLDRLKMKSIVNHNHQVFIDVDLDMVTEPTFNVDSDTREVYNIYTKYVTSKIFTTKGVRSLRLSGYKFKTPFDMNKIPKTDISTTNKKQLKSFFDNNSNHINRRIDRRRTLIRRRT